MSPRLPMPVEQTAIYVATEYAVANGYRVARNYWRQFPQAARRIEGWVGMLNAAGDAEAGR